MRPTDEARTSGSIAEPINTYISISSIRQQDGSETNSASDFGIEIGGQPTFEDLPRTIRGAGQRLARKLCVACHQRRSLFRYRGRVRFDADHDLCFQCYRAVMDRFWATVLGE
jgi:hypothetical protein